MGLFKVEGNFYRPNNLEHFRQRNRAEIKQISPDAIEPGVQCLHSCR
jgi:hypothetical protein